MGLGYPILAVLGFLFSFNHFQIRQHVFLLHVLIYVLLKLKIVLYKWKKKANHSINRCIVSRSLWKLGKLNVAKGTGLANFQVFQGPCEPHDRFWIIAGFVTFTWAWLRLSWFYFWWGNFFSLNQHNFDSRNYYSGFVAPERRLGLTFARALCFLSNAVQNKFFFLKKVKNKLEFWYVSCIPSWNIRQPSDDIKRVQLCRRINKSLKHK